uniref:Cytochrome c oxidase subunit 5B, mitochondrial n=1 Tax=Canis lupus dingo TaxID=286419 RepID=A0A8C0R7Q9_CANLU
MASRLLRGVGALAAQALRARGPNGVAAVRSMASGGGVPTDDEQATGLEREVMMAARKGLVRNSFLCYGSFGIMPQRQLQAPKKTLI